MVPAKRNKLMSFFDDSSLAFLPSGAAGKDGKAYSIKPTDGTGDFTFSRGSNLAATRVGPTGLIEKGRENLLVQSNQFDTTWTNYLSTETSGQIGYDGTTDAWLLTKSDASGQIRQNVTSSGVATFSVYAKANASDYIQIVCGSVYQFFDLSLGVLAAGNGIAAAIEAIGTNGWYRCSVSFNSSITSVRIYPAEENATGAISGSIYIQDAQLEIGLAATDYIESGATTGKAGLLEDEPRFDYSGGATCPSLLLEPSRTNLVKYSEYFEGTGWLIGANTEKVSSNNLSPSGELNAYKFKSINITGSTFVRFSAVVADNTDYTFSCYARSDNPSALTTGKLLQLQMSGGGQITSISSTLVTSEWQRFDITATSGTTSTAYCYLGTDYDVDAEIEFWGAQLEAGSYPTSYIPNHSGGTITRGADDAYATGLSSSIGQNEGSLFIEWEQKLSDDVYAMFGLNDGLNNNRLNLALNQSGNSRLGLVYRVNSVSHYSDVNIQSLNVGTIYKAAIVYTQTTLKMYLNGTIVVNETGFSASGGTFNELNFKLQSSGSSFIFTMPVKQTLVFPEALSDADCITLTT